MAVTLHYSGTQFKLSRVSTYKRWISTMAGYYGFEIGEINIFFCSDSVIKAINWQLLRHDFPTDVITVPYTVGTILHADVHIGIETVTANAIRFRQSRDDEISRVIAHAVLHLVGFSDTTPAQRLEMRDRERFWLAQLPR